MAHFMSRQVYLDINFDHTRRRALVEALNNYIYSNSRLQAYRFKVALYLSNHHSQIQRFSEEIKDLTFLPPLKIDIGLSVMR